MLWSPASPLPHLRLPCIQHGNVRVRVPPSRVHVVANHLGDLKCQYLLSSCSEHAGTQADGEIDNFSTIQRRSAATEVPIWGAFITCRMEPDAIQEMEDFKTRVLRTGLRLTEDVPQVIMSIIDLYLNRGTWLAALNLLTSFAQILVGLIPRIVYGLIPCMVAMTDDVAGAAKTSAREDAAV